MYCFDLNRDAGHSPLRPDVHYPLHQTGWERQAWLVSSGSSCLTMLATRISHSEVFDAGKRRTGHHSTICQRTGWCVGWRCQRLGHHSQSRAELCFFLKRLEALLGVIVVLRTMVETVLVGTVPAGSPRRAMH